MSVKYSLARMTSKPGDQSAPKMYYAKAQADGVVTMDDMAEEIAYATSLTDGDVLNVIRALIRQTRVKLAAGKIVQMENLGSFQIQLGSRGAVDPKSFTSANIRRCHIQFRPGKMVAAGTRVEGLTFERVAPLPKKGGSTDGSGDGGDEGGEIIDPTV